MLLLKARTLGKSSAAVLLFFAFATTAQAGGAAALCGPLLASKPAAATLFGTGSGGSVPVVPVVFIGGVALGILAHELDGPACASNTKRNRARGYNSATFWRPYCDPKKSKRRPRPKPVSVYG